MADASYDVVVVGGGTKTLPACMYLTKYGGMSVGIFEERHELAAGMTSEESPAPGFLANECANIIGDIHAYYGPIYDDFPEWIEYGARPESAKITNSVCFPDGTWCGNYGVEYDPTQEKTAKSIAKFSEKDAETWLWLYDKMEKYYRPALMQSMFNPPTPLGVPDAVDRLYANPETGADPQWITMTYVQVLQDLFESQEVQLLFARRFQAQGRLTHAYGVGRGVPTGLCTCVNSGNFPGGTHAPVHGYQRVIAENGGKIFTRSPVQKIIIENGTAKGILLEDGTVVEAKKAVLSGVDPYQLCVELVGEEHLGPKIIRRIKNLELDYTAILWYTWALYEKPSYIAEQFDPDLRDSMWIALATSRETGLQDLLEEAYRRKLGLWPDMEKQQLHVDDHSLYIPGFAPPGRSTILTEQWVLAAHYYTEQEWKELEKTMADAQLKHWQKYAPNVTWDNIIGYVPVTPFSTSQMARNWGRRHGNWSVIDQSPSQVGRWRPLLELSSGRMPIKNLYATGGGWAPGAGGWGAGGYCIYKVMAEDFGLRKPWEEKGRPY
ncbi:phytoene desaturase family protein [Chloroflexota bacterium]